MTNQSKRTYSKEQFLASPRFMGIAIEDAIKVVERSITLKPTAVALSFSRIIWTVKYKRLTA
ncbi:hypothetical protein D3C85_794200 [compost metagenome]